MNVILVVFDSLRKDCVGCYGQPPWGKVHTPVLDALAKESLVFDRAYPESLPTLPTRRALYTGRRVYPFHMADYRLRGDFVGAPGWGPIPEDQPTVAESLQAAGVRTALVSDVYHQFKPSKNYWRGFDQWVFLRGQETDPYRSGPKPSQAEIDRWLPAPLQAPARVQFVTQCLMNMYGRDHEEDYFNARVLAEAAKWLEENRDADRFFLCVESFDPHEPWFVPEYYRQMYPGGDQQAQVLSIYGDTESLGEDLVRGTQASYSGLVTMCDRWLGHLVEAMRTHGLLENTVLMVTTDHGHHIGEGRFLGKRGYPSGRGVFDVPLIIRHPQGQGEGKRSGIFLQHTDMAAQILQFAGVEAKERMDGRPFWQDALNGVRGEKDHVTVAWGSAITVIDSGWWFNAKIDGSGPFLYDLSADPDLTLNVADEHPEECRRLFGLGVNDAEGGFPDYLMDICKRQADAPGCSALVARG